MFRAVVVVVVCTRQGLLGERIASYDKILETYDEMRILYRI